MLRINVSRADTAILETETITAGRAGLQCGFTFSADWDGLAKTVVVNGTVKRDVVLVNDTIIVPAECLATANYTLRIGVCGASGNGEIVIPTLWTNFGKILPSAQPSGADPDEVTPDVVAQIQQNSSDALRLAQEVLRRADSGEFDGRDGATGPSGPPGNNGRNGTDGISPEVSVYPMTGGNRVVIVDAEGPHTFDVTNGLPGAPGEDGISPEVSVVQTAGGHRVIIIDSRGTNQFDVLDGADGTDGDPGVYVGATEPTDPTVRVWVDTDGDADDVSGVFWATYNTTTEAEVTAAVTAGKAVLCKISDEIFYLVNKAAIGPSGSAWIFASANQTSMRVTWVSGSYWNSIGTRTIPTNTSDLTNDSGFLTSYTETDPTVPSWAKASSKPSYTAAEVGAAPAVTEVTVSTAGAVTQALDAGKIYHFTGALTALTITLNAAASGQLAQYHFDFNCGSTVPTVTLPGTVILPDDHEWEASKHYEVDILNNFGAVMSWATS